MIDEKRDVGKEIRRQSFHITAGLLIFLAYAMLPAETVIMGLFFAFVVIFLMAEGVVRGIRYPILHTYYMKFEREKDIYATPMIGPMFAVLGILLPMAIIPHRNIVMCCILNLAFFDGFSTLFGVMFGKHPLPLNRDKSWEGTIGGFVPTLAANYVVLGNPVIALVSALTAAIVEGFSKAVDDNTMVPVMSGAVLWLLVMFAGVTI